MILMASADEREVGSEFGVNCFGDGLRLISDV